MTLSTSSLLFIQSLQLPNLPGLLSLKIVKGLPVRLLFLVIKDHGVGQHILSIAGGGGAIFKILDNLGQFVVVGCLGRKSHGKILLSLGVV